MGETFLASAGRLIWRVAEAQGLSGQALFTSAGLEPRWIDDGSARYPFDRICHVCLAIAEATGNRRVGLTAAREYRVTDLHALGIAFLCSTDLLEAFRRVDRYETLMNSGVDVVLETTGTELRVYFDGPEMPPETRPVMEDLRVAVLLEVTRQALDRDAAPLRVEFTYARPDNTTAHEALLRCQTVFSAERSCMAFDHELAKRPFPGRNRDLARRHDQVLDAMLSQLTDDTFIDRVRGTIIEQLPSGAPGLAEVASQLAMSPRTLHRRLAERNVNFRELLTRVRAELAMAYLTERSLPVTEVGFLVGYADVSAFSRAFKRWTGQTPRDFAHPS